MATRTRYRRGSSSAYGYGGSWLRSWFGGSPPAASPGAGGSSANAFQNVQRAAQSAPEAPYQQMQAALSMGGTVLGTSQNGAITYVSIGGMVVSFNSVTGVQIGQPVPANAAAGGGPPAAPAGGGPQGGGPQGGGGPASRVGQQVSAQTANGVVTGTITGEENGVTTVQWSDGTVATYGADGKLVNSTPPTSTTTPPAGEDETPTGETPTGETETTETPVTPEAGAGVTPTDDTTVPPPPLPGPVGPAGPIDPSTYVEPAPVAGTPSDPDNPYSTAYNPLAPAPAPTIEEGGMAPPAGPVGPSGPLGFASMPAPAPAYQAPAPVYQPPPTPIDYAQREGERSSYVAPLEPQISTQWGWLTPSQLEAMFAATYNAPPEMSPTPPPQPPPAPSPVAPAYDPYGASLDPGVTDPYVAPQQPASGGSYLTEF